MRQEEGQERSIHRVQLQFHGNDMFRFVDTTVAPMLIPRCIEPTKSDIMLEYRYSLN